MRIPDRSEESRTPTADQLGELNPSLAQLVTARLKTPRVVAIAASVIILGAAAVFSVIRATSSEQLSGDTLQVDATGGSVAPTIAELSVTVHLVGAVSRPGVYEFSEGSRVHDAVTKAGGLTDDAAANALNLARILVDGEQIIIPTEAEVAAMSATQSQSVEAVPGSGNAGSVINLNTATLEQLDTLPGIGPALAQRILDWRSANGGFGSVDQLGEVSGIGSKLFDRLRSLVTV